MSDYTRKGLPEQDPIQTTFNDTDQERAILDPESYMADLDGFEMEDEQKRELLTILWDIMGRFVRLGIDVEICERIFEVGEIGFAPSGKTLESMPLPLNTEK